MGRTKQVIGQNGPRTLQSDRVKQQMQGSVDEEKSRCLKSARTIRKRASCYRNMARRVGYIPGFSVDLAAGNDAVYSIVSTRDVKRLARFNPACPDGQFDSKQQAANRGAVLQEALPPSALEAAQAHVEVMFRAVMNDAVLRGVENNRLRVSAASMHSALRKYSGKLSFPGTEPVNALLIRAGVAQETTTGVAAASDEEARQSFKEGVRKQNRSSYKTTPTK
tara:strand:+ start:2514 stop:3179 length:666 start_codon:yes stop_codon:yes gene_type:complete